MFRNFLLRGIIIAYIYDALLFLFLAFTLASTLSYGRPTDDYGWGQAIMFIWLWPTFHLVALILSALYSLKATNKISGFLKFFVVFTVFQSLPLLILFAAFATGLSIKNMTNIISVIAILFASQVVLFVLGNRFFKN